MKATYCLLMISFLFTGCYRPTENTNAKDTLKVKDTQVFKSNYTQEIQPASWDTVPCGDLNADKILDTAFVYTPQTIRNLNEKGEAMGSDQLADSLSYNRVRFSCALPEMKFYRSVWGEIANVGDLNKDGTCELLFRPGWFWSCWGRVYLCSLKDGAWTLPMEVRANICTDDPLKSRLIKKGKKYYVVGEKFEDGDQFSYQVPVKL